MTILIRNNPLKRLFFFLILLLCTPLAEASPLSLACQKLAADADNSKKCSEHATYFELNSHYVLTCASLHADTEARMRCLKSGADLETINLCKNLGWNIENTLTCLRTNPTQESIHSCRNFSKEENTQLRCLRLGREQAQVQACQSFSKFPEERFRCLEMDISAADTRTCRNHNPGVEARFLCLQGVVAEREREFRAVLAETQKRVSEEKALEKQLLADEESRKRRKAGRSLASEPPRVETGVWTEKANK